MSTLQITADAVTVHDASAAPGRSPLFSPTGRFRAGRALSAYLWSELRAGRTLESVFEDRGVRDAVRERPYLLEDLSFDQDLAEAMRQASVPRSLEEIETAAAREGSRW